MFTSVWDTGSCVRQLAALLSARYGGVRLTSESPPNLVNCGGYRPLRFAEKRAICGLQVIGAGTLVMLDYVNVDSAWTDPGVTVTDNVDLAEDVRSL